MMANVCVSQSVLQHAAVVDCAVVGLEDQLKGVVPLALCVLKNGERCVGDGRLRAAFHHPLLS